MADFINTIDLLGDEIVAASFLDRTITEFNDDVITTVGEAAFSGCASLTSINLPNLITIQDSEAFSSCSNLVDVNIPKVQQLDGYAFSKCYKIASVSLPNVTNISNYAFYYCSSLADVTLPAVPPTLSNVNAFQMINSACVFHIPAGSLSAYQSATNWSTLTGQYTFTEDA